MSSTIKSFVENPSIYLIKPTILITNIEKGDKTHRNLFKLFEFAVINSSQDSKNCDFYREIGQVAAISLTRYLHDFETPIVERFFALNEKLLTLSSATTHDTTHAIKKEEKVSNQSGTCDGQNFLGRLPKEIRLQLAQYLSLGDIGSLANTCKKESQRLPAMLPQIQKLDLTKRKYSKQELIDICQKCPNLISIALDTKKFSDYDLYNQNSISVDLVALLKTQAKQFNKLSI